MLIYICFMNLKENDITIEDFDITKFILIEKKETYAIGTYENDYIEIPIEDLQKDKINE